jgi:hypothetical protein
MCTLQKLFALIDAEHVAEPCKDSSKINFIEHEYRCRLPEDLKAFYRKYNSVELFRHELGATYRFVPVHEIHPTWLDILGEDTDERGPDNWLTFCDVLDGNYVAIEVCSAEARTHNFIDCFHDTFAIPGESRIVAKTFTEFLEKALVGGGGLPYFVRKDFQTYGDAFDSVQ